MIKISKVAVVIGSTTQNEIAKKCIQTLESFDIEVDAHIMSAHRNPETVREYALNARKNGVEVIIAMAAKSAHLAGVFASYTTVPVIALPAVGKGIAGIDSLLSMVQMPKGVPVATVGLDAGENAAILAVEMLAIKYTNLVEKLESFKKEVALKIDYDDTVFRTELNK